MYLRTIGTDPCPVWFIIDRSDAPAIDAARHDRFEVNERPSRDLSNWRYVAACQRWAKKAPARVKTIPRVATARCILTGD